MSPSARVRPLSSRSLCAFELCRCDGHLEDEGYVPRPRPKLTDAFIAKIRAPGIHRDGPGGIPGLLVRAGKTARTWELRSERPPKFTKTLGRWDDPFNPMKEAAARAEAHELLARHRRGAPTDETSP